MAEARTRPDVKEIKDAYDYLFNSHYTATKLKDAALAGRLFQGVDDGAGVAGRSMAWKLFLVPNEPLQTVAGVEAAPPVKSIQAARDAYRALLMEKMRAPDGGYEEGFTIPGLGTSPPRTEKSTGNLEKNNPLSLHDENPWREWFTAMELRKTILQDVERTFPDIAYFRDAEVQAELTNVLFLYSTMHPDIGYRQGMHELLAPLYYALDYDSLPDDAGGSVDASLKEFCAHQWVAADSWLLFTAAMKGAGRWYEWQEGKSQPEPSPLPSHVQLNVAAGDARVKPYIAPIVEACNRIQSVFLKGVDPELWKAMQSAGIEPQIYGIRWLRLLFTREFNMQDAMVLWDGLFAVDPSFDLALWVCVAMLVRIRNKLIPADYSTQLTYLLRYPSDTPSAGGSNDETPIHHTTLLLRQALTLQMSPTPTIGVSVIHENKNLLGIATEVPPPVSPPVRRRPRGGEGHRSFAGDSSAKPEAGSSRGHHNRQQSSSLGLPETFARGLLERGESLGINKTVMNAVSELKRNLPDLATALGRLPLTPQPAQTTYPLSPERPNGERPPWEPKSRFEMEREISQLQSLQRKIGDTVGWVVDTLLLDESEIKDDAERKTVEKRKREALECLSYARDVLKGAVSEVDDERLVGEEEARRRREKATREREAAEALSRKHSTPHPPLPAAAIPIEARPQGIGARRSQDYFMPHPSGTSARSRVPVPTPPTVPAVLPPPLSSIASAPTIPLPTSPTLQSPSLSAPWNYTKSSFSSGSSPIATLPRVPPRTSTVLPRAGPLPPSLRPPPPVAVPSPPEVGSREQKPKAAPYDPLGAIP
ncbi:rab-GTPase-TBC domain-containing protein [Trametes maxima]|nr:rab-GTPase-TBC domain-containing protein [Trametes maxima]